MFISSAFTDLEYLPFSVLAAPPPLEFLGHTIKELAPDIKPLHVTDCIIDKSTLNFNYHYRKSLLTVIILIDNCC